MAVYSITHTLDDDSTATELFISLDNPSNPSGAPELTYEGSSSFQRPGIDGVSIRKEGTRSQDFEMRGEVDVASLSAAVSKVASYRAIEGKQVKLVWHSTSYHGSTLQHEFYVKRARATYRKLGANVGGLTGANAAYLVESSWILIPVDVST